MKRHLHRWQVSAQTRTNGCETSLNGIQQIQAEWQGRAGVEVSDFLRCQGVAARKATRVLPHEGREMHEGHEERIRRTTTEI